MTKLGNNSNTYANMVKRSINGNTSTEVDQEVHKDLINEEKFHIPDLKPTKNVTESPKLASKSQIRNKYLEKMKHVLVGKFSQPEKKE
ncbi:hypothetical protein LIER_41042 [Lithospermum erythrorhizon]|uniref:Uncharacterized protein n=1 Tax=Lithospermum erythrorhizon TaxID=34254 RepID=A0AAV3R6M2_LITER